jgi:ATP-dependent RNA helicase HelY
MHCHLGDFQEYAGLRRQIADVEKQGAKKRSASRRAEAALSLESLRLGDVVRVPTGRRAGWAVVVAPARTTKGGHAQGPTVVTEDRQLRRLTVVDVPEPVEPVTTLRVSTQFNARSPKARRDLVSTMRAAVPHEPPRRSGRTAAADEDSRVQDLRHRLKAHPCHQCPEREDHARWAERWWRLKRETVGLQRQVEGRTNTVAHTFDRICSALAQLGYLSDDGRAVTQRGEGLRRLYTERDLLTAECLRHDVWRRLDAPGLAACVSALVYEPRSAEADLSPRLPTEEVTTALAEMDRLWGLVEELETQHALPTTGVPDAGMAWMVHRWASGARLDAVLRGRDVSAGDFVRRCKQIVDLLDQIGDAATDPELRRTSRKAVDAIRRGVVAADRLD